MGKETIAAAILESRGIARGFRLKENEPPSALNGFLYSLLRGTKQQRRALVLSMLKQFDENSKNPLAQLLYLADNLAAFPYQVCVCKVIKKNFRYLIDVGSNRLSPNFSGD